jgi:phage terminase large subunit-like protein
MGQRGPGSKNQRAVARRAVAPIENCPLFAGFAPKASDKMPWQKRGLNRAGRVIAFLESLPTTKGLGEGKPLKLMDWQREWIKSVYADGSNKKRKVRTALLSAARGNGKTVLIAGLSLCHLCGPESEPRGECYSAGATREQAALTFAEMEATILQTPWMSARLNIKRFGKIIEDSITGSVYKALASDGPAAHGLASSFIACDELAQWKRRELFDVLRTSMGKRTSPLMAVISTQSPHATNIMSELVDYAERVRSGEVDDITFHGTLYAAPEGCALDDESGWYAANPALGVFRSLDELRSEAARAQRMPTSEPAFRNLYLNQRIDADPKAINPAEWESCASLIGPATLQGQRCFGGLDLSSTRDLTALVLFFPDSGALLSYFWIPKDELGEREETDRVPYRTWAKQGFIRLVPGKAIDKQFIARDLAQICSGFAVQSIGYDRWMMQDLKNILNREGISLPLVEWGQGFASMGPAVNAFETAMLSGKLHHGNHPVLRWNASNLIFETDPAGLRKPSKSRSIDKIDGIVAAIMACGVAAKNEEQAPFDASRAVMFM